MNHCCSDFCYMDAVKNNKKGYIIKCKFKYDNYLRLKEKIKELKLRYLYEPEINLFCILGEGYTIQFCSHLNRGTIYVKDPSKRKSAFIILKKLNG